MMTSTRWAIVQVLTQVLITGLEMVGAVGLFAGEDITNLI